MIVPAKQKHKLYQGATWSWVYQVNDSDGLPKDLAGCTATLMLRDKPANVTGSVVRITSTGVISIPSTAGQVRFIIPPADSIGETWVESVFDAELYWPDTHIDKLAIGTFTLIQEITYP